MQKRIIYLIFKPNPSAIVRAEIFKSILAKNGVEASYYYDYSRSLVKFVELFNRFKIPYLVFYYSLGIIQKIIGMVKRVGLMSRISGYDGLVALKYIEPAFLEQLKKGFKGKILYDFDDAVWLPGWLGKENFERIIQLADFVSCDNSYLKLAAEKFNSNVFVLNGPCQLELFSEIKQKDHSGPLVIGWLGSPSTVFYLFAIYDALEEIASRYPNVVLHIIGTGYYKIPQFERMKVVRIPNYNQAKMIEHLKEFDIGVYPLFNNELSLGRGSLKATIYMASKIPAVCMSLGENNNLIEDGKNGYLARNTDEWVVRLSKLIEDGQLRKDIGMNGYKFANQRFSLNACYNQLYSNFLSKL